MGQNYLKYCFSGIEGSNCYCSDEAAERIRALLEGMDLATPLWMGSGDYHYISLFRGERLLGTLSPSGNKSLTCKRSFAGDGLTDKQSAGNESQNQDDTVIELIYFDNHPDDQDDAFCGDMLSCGNWVKWYRRLGGVQTTWHNGKGEIITSPDCAKENICTLPPVHLSIDLDVLSREYAHTNWDQGSMSLDELCRRVSAIAASRRIACIDFCGGIAESKGGTPEDDALNTLAVETILRSL